MKTFDQLKDQQIGFVRVNQPVHHDRRDFECAAWWKHEESATGVFPVYLRQYYYDKRIWNAVAELPAKITDCYFGSLWCGNPIGNYDKTEDLKRAATVYVSLPIFEALDKTGNSQDKEGNDWAIHPDVMESAIAHYLRQVDQDIANMPQWVKEHQAHGVGENSRHLSMVGYSRRCIRESRKIAERLIFIRDYRAERCNQECLRKNLSWAPAFDISPSKNNQPD